MYRKRLNLSKYMHDVCIILSPFSLNLPLYEHKKRPSYNRYLRHWIFCIQKLECCIPSIKSIGYSVSTVFFLESDFDMSAHQDPHLVSHSNGPFSRHNTAQRPQGGGGYSDFFFIRRLGPRIYRSPKKTSGI